MREAIYEVLEELTTLDGVSGHETAVVRRLSDLLRPVTDDLTVDHMGNIYAVRKGAKPGPTVAVFAHSDEIGMMVTSIDPDGFIRFTTIGGTPVPVLPGRVVRINGRSLGVTGIKSGHYQTAEDASRATPVADSFIDVGAESASDVQAMGIAVGDPIVIVAPLVRLTHNPDLVAGKAVDNRIACALLCRLFLDRVSVPAGTLMGVIAVQEEVGLRGARVAAHRVQPDLAIVVDTMPAAGTPDMRRHAQLNAMMGRGPVFQVMSRGFLLPDAMKELLVGTAQEAGIPHQLSALHTSNTDAAEVHLSGKGIPTGVIALARRYSHSPVELLDLKDAAHALDLLQRIVGRMDRLPAFSSGARA